MTNRRAFLSAVPIAISGCLNPSGTPTPSKPTGRIREIELVDDDPASGIFWEIEYQFSGESYENPDAKVIHGRDGELDQFELYDYPGSIHVPNNYLRIGGEFEIRLLWQGRRLDSAQTTIEPMELNTDFKNLELESMDYGGQTILEGVELVTTNKGGVAVYLVELLFKVEGKSTSATGGAWNKEFVPALEPGGSRSYWFDPNAIFEEGEEELSVSVRYNGGGVGSARTSIDEW